MATRSKRSTDLLRRINTTLQPYGFQQMGLRFRLRADNGNGIVVELQTTSLSPRTGPGAGNAWNFYVNVALVLGPHMEWRGDPWLDSRWRVNIIDTVFFERLSPDGWNGTYIWQLGDSIDRPAPAEAICARLHGELPRLLELLDPAAMVAAARAGRWPRANTVEGFMLADRGDVAGVRALIGEDRGTEPVMIEKGMVEFARKRAAGSPTRGWPR